MKYAVLIALISIIAYLPSCYSPDFPDLPRTVICTTPEDYNYHNYYEMWLDSVCTTDLCSIYTTIWKELLIERTTLTEPYFNKHFEIVESKITSGSDGEFFIVGYRVLNDWAIAYWGDGFIIKIDELNTSFPEIGLPKGTYLSKEEIGEALDSRGFESKIHEIPKTGPLKYSSRNEALDALIKEAKVDTLCFNRVTLSVHTWTLTLEAFARYEDEENECIDASIDLITGYTHIRDRLCTKIWGH